MKKLLLVDDDDSIQLLYQEEFKDEGYQVDSARNGEEALARFAENRPDLVILDVMMPGLNGIEVLRQMKSRDPSVPVLINSAYSNISRIWAPGPRTAISSNQPI